MVDDGEMAHGIGPNGGEAHERIVHLSFISEKAIGLML
jgi:hypothetical protein